MEWLNGPSDKWLKSNVVPDFDIINSEKRETVISAGNHEETSDGKYYDRYSSCDQLLTVTAWVYGFCISCKVEKCNQISGFLTLEEINKAEIALLKIVNRNNRFQERIINF